MNGDIETVYVKGQWRNVFQGGFDDQEEAAAEGRHLARRLGVEWFQRARSGRFRLRNTYPRWLDPRRSKG